MLCDCEYCKVADLQTSEIKILKFMWDNDCIRISVPEGYHLKVTLRAKCHKWRNIFLIHYNLATKDIVNRMFGFVIENVKCQLFCRLNNFRRHTLLFRRSPLMCSSRELCSYSFSVKTYFFSHNIFKISILLFGVLAFKCYSFTQISNTGQNYWKLMTGHLEV